MSANMMAALSWVLKAFREIGATTEQIDAEREKLIADQRYLDLWCRATGFKALDVPEQIHFQTVEHTATITVPTYGQVTLKVASHYRDSTGIGHYEAWGVCGYDSGTEFIVVDKMDIVSVEDNADKIAYLDWFLNTAACGVVDEETDAEKERQRAREEAMY